MIPLTKEGKNHIADKTSVTYENRVWWGGGIS